MDMLLHLKGVPPLATSGSIREFFLGYEIPYGGVIIPSEGHAFVRFTKTEDLLRSISKDGSYLFGEPLELLLITEPEVDGLTQQIQRDAAEAEARSNARDHGKASFGYDGPSSTYGSELAQPSHTSTQSHDLPAQSYDLKNDSAYMDHPRPTVQEQPHESQYRGQGSFYLEVGQVDPYVTIKDVRTFFGSLADSIPADGIVVRTTPPPSFYVEFNNEQDYNIALMMNGKKLGGRPVTLQGVSPAEFEAHCRPHNPTNSAYKCTFPAYSASRYPPVASLPATPRTSSEPAYGRPPPQPHASSQHSTSAPSICIDYGHGSGRSSNTDRNSSGPVDGYRRSMDNNSRAYGDRPRDPTPSNNSRYSSGPVDRYHRSMDNNSRAYGDRQRDPTPSNNSRYSSGPIDKYHRSMDNNTYGDRQRDSTPSNNSQKSSGPVDNYRWNTDTTDSRNRHTPSNRGFEVQPTLQNREQIFVPAGHYIMMDSMPSWANVNWIKYLFKDNRLMNDLIFFVSYQTKALYAYVCLGDAQEVVKALKQNGTQVGSDVLNVKSVSTAQVKMALDNIPSHLSVHVSQAPIKPPHPVGITQKRSAPQAQKPNKRAKGGPKVAGGVQNQQSFRAKAKQSRWQQGAMVSQTAKKPDVPKPAPSAPAAMFSQTAKKPDVPQPVPSAPAAMASQTAKKPQPVPKPLMPLMPPRVIPSGPPQPLMTTPRASQPVLVGQPVRYGPINLGKGMVHHAMQSKKTKPPEAPRNYNPFDTRHVNTVRLLHDLWADTGEVQPGPGEEKLQVEGLPLGPEITPEDALSFLSSPPHSYQIVGGFNVFKRPLDQTNSTVNIVECKIKIPTKTVTKYVSIKGYTCKVVHPSQYKVCLSCRQYGHMRSDFQICPAFAKNTNCYFLENVDDLDLAPGNRSCKIPYNGRKHKSFEHAFLWAEFTAMKLPHIANKTLQTSDRKVFRELLHGVNFYRSINWEKDSYDLVVDLLRAKYKKCPRFQTALQMTKDRKIFFLHNRPALGVGITGLGRVWNLSPEYMSMSGMNIYGRALVAVRDEMAAAPPLEIMEPTQQSDEEDEDDDDDGDEEESMTQTSSNKKIPYDKLLQGIVEAVRFEGLPIGPSYSVDNITDWLMSDPLNLEIIDEPRVYGKKHLNLYDIHVVEVKVQGPIVNPVLPERVVIAGYMAKVHHPTQRRVNRVCRFCRMSTHDSVDKSCKAYMETKGKVHYFASDVEDELSPNGNSLPITYLGMEHESVVHAYVYKEAQELEKLGIKTEFQTRSGTVRKREPTLKADKYQMSQWEAQSLDLWIELYQLKWEQSTQFRQKLANTRNLILAFNDQRIERGAGLHIKLTDTYIANPDYLNGLNLVGKALMTVRERNANDPRFPAPDCNALASAEVKTDSVDSANNGEQIMELGAADSVTPTEQRAADSVNLTEQIVQSKSTEPTETMIEDMEISMSPTTPSTDHIETQPVCEGTVFSQQNEGSVLQREESAPPVDMEMAPQSQPSEGGVSLTGTMSILSSHLDSSKPTIAEEPKKILTSPDTFNIPTFRDLEPTEDEEVIEIEGLPLSPSLPPEKAIEWLQEPSRGLDVVGWYNIFKRPPSKLSCYEVYVVQVKVKKPVDPVLRKTDVIGDHAVKLMHESQGEGDVCIACRRHGHTRQDTDQCRAYTKDNNLHFIENLETDELSPTYPMEIDFEGLTHQSLNHAYLWKEAMDLGCPDIASKILLAQTSAEVRKLWTNLHFYDSLNWELKNYRLCKELYNIRWQKCAKFRTALRATGNKPILYHHIRITRGIGVTGLKKVELMKPRYYPGLNMIGSSLMELRTEMRSGNVQPMQSNQVTIVIDDEDYE